MEVDVLRQRVKVRLEDQPEVMAYYANSDIAVLRSGKAKKTDEPIPADLAPISGGKKQQKKKETEEMIGLEPIRFRYSEENVAEEPAEELPAEELAAEAPKKNSGNRRNHRRNRPKNPASPENPEKPQQSENKEPAQEGEKAAKKPHRRYGRHHRRKPKPDGQ